MAVQNQTEMLQELTIGFLRQHYPFDLLSDDELKTLAQAGALDYIPKDTPILTQDGKPSEFLYVIQKGSVRVSVHAENGDDIIIDMRGEGEHFGMTSMMRGTMTQMNITAAEDLMVYLFPQPLVVEVLQRNPPFSEAILQITAQRYLERALREIRYGEVRSGSDRLLFTMSVRELIKRPPIDCSPTTTIQRAAAIMRDAHVSSILINDAKGFPIGIVTDRDLRNKVVANGLSPMQPITKIMAAPVTAVDREDLAFEALLKMLNSGIHHLLVTENGKGIGVITSTDLMMLQGSSPLFVAKGINRQATLQDLIVSLQRVNQTVPLMFKEGARPSSIARVTAEINDRVTIKLLQLAEEKLGQPPLLYCWLVLGSEGRKEQTFKTDQDNALIYADPANETQAAAAEKYFADLANFVGDALERCGYPKCPGNYMARNPKWCKPIRTWQSYFYRWIETPEPQEVLYSTIFFDLRPVGPTQKLGTDLQDYVLRQTRNKGVFLAHMARLSVEHTPPLGFFRHFVLERSGPHKDTFNIKERGTGPIVDLVRLLALEHGISETNTPERLNALVKADKLSKESADELIHTLEFLMLLRMRHQVQAVEGGETPNNYLNPHSLTTIDRTTLKESFQIIARWQADISDRYMISQLA
ncbi:MAG: cyclic nucleotide-binding/CBS domain-containing protein [Chloroflexi bacterium]|nr:cyclic nucleotide-binding/CBS domain-containing protein [Chloroflexota bacterium]